MLDGPIQMIDGCLIAVFHSIHQTVLDVILENEFPGVVDGGFHSGKLNQHLGAVLPVFHHSLDGFQMPDGAGETVEDCFCLRVCMGMLGEFRMRVGVLGLRHGIHLVL